VLVAVALKNVGIIEDDSDVLMVLQVANTSRGSNGPSSNTGGGNVGNAATTHAPVAGAGRNASILKAQERRATTHGYSTYTKGSHYPKDTRWLFAYPPRPPPSISPRRRGISAPHLKLPLICRWRMWRFPSGRQRSNGMS
jgi:hypothetical protein